MRDIIDRQTFVFSIDMLILANSNTSQIQTGLTLRFAADEMILKHITYTTVPAAAGGADDIADMVQIWCNITNDNLITAFPNGVAYTQYPNLHFTLNNRFQTGNIIFQFLQTANGAPLYYLPQPGIVAGGVSHTNGILAFTIEFVKYEK